MLTYREMYEELRLLWRSMAKREFFSEDLYVYFERPKRGQGYQGGGEYYIYTIGNTYYLSYSERGTEDIITTSEDFTDIKFEIADVMSRKIALETIRTIKSIKNKLKKA